jgi:hypothetical protein
MVRSLHEIMKDGEKNFPIQSTKAVLLSKDERHFIYNQLLARKYQCEEELLRWAERKDTDEILRVSNLINLIQQHMNKLIG